MNCARRERTQRHANVQAVADRPERAPKVRAVFRLADDTVCHARCGRPLAFQGVRGLIEADFYCYACLTHVTIPVAVLHDLPVTADAADTALSIAAL